MTPPFAEDEEEVCAVCHEVEKGGSEMLECGRCLRGFHLCCLDPPLSAVPEDEWVCPDCAAGRKAPPCAGTTARARVLADNGLALARIDALWEVRSDAAAGRGKGRGKGRRAGPAEEAEYAATLRWYCIPEQTHVGRQAHHAAREVFLTHTRDVNDAATLLRHAHVLPAGEFWRAPPELGDDRFKRRSEFGAGASESEDEAWEPTSAALQLSSDDEEDPGTRSKSVYALWVEKGLVPHKNLRGYGTATARPRRQGGDDLLGTVGRSATEPLAVAAARRSASALTLAREALAPHAAPRRLPCRDKEREAVEAFVRAVLGQGAGKAEAAEEDKPRRPGVAERRRVAEDPSDQQNTGPFCSGGRCLYISGIPGTGKTATVREVMRSARQRAERGELAPFRFVEINGLRLPSPQHAYCALLEALTGERLGPASAAAALEAMFGGERGPRVKAVSAPRRPIIVLLDELDCLINRSQTVLYNMFDWPTRAGSRLSIIGIANTMDLPERLHPRIGSRLAGRRLPFQPYGRDQLETILRARLEGIDAFEPSALVLVSRRVANCSGDIRLALEICASGPPLERLLLAAAHLEARFSGRAEAELGAVGARLADLLAMAPRGLARAGGAPGAVLRAAQSLAAERLLLCDAPARRLRARVALNIPVPELLYVLTSDESLQWLSPLLGSAA
ncbi:hypothetical protein QBZ16_003372 [Prototheca wickerhamii]|uniref:Origin recognition complex subunit 1 n=1 Tax=Prototheca wickerhamii TaxID=3111 RepID=A0AAD9ILQ4_PROWI|nr:hypothetical protein QBZ16_003372 [Prototheca wickerhamii]